MEDTWLLIPGRAEALKLAKYAGTETRQPPAGKSR